ncbi:hypothetical protein V470_11030 [Streptococcus sp. VT 162]|nr:hypothetical protein V470_11030 [Streptococcus sp. VT 162]
MAFTWSSVSAVESWTSEAGKSKDLNLAPGTYTFHEEAAPTGYLKVTDITFQVKLKKYIQEQEKHDIALDKLSVKEYEDPFRDSGK